MAIDVKEMALDDTRFIIKKLREVMELPEKIVNLRLELDMDNTPRVTVEFIPEIKGM